MKPCVEIDPAAESWRHQEGTAPVGVLLCHGFTGSVASMKPWGEALAGAGHHVVIPRLPGHGTSWQELNRTTWMDWYAVAERALFELRDTCEQVVVAGLSMGGALALRLAEEHSVRGVILVNPAIASRSRTLVVAGVLKHVVPSVAAIGNDIAKPGVDEHSYDRTPLLAVHSMTRLWSVVRADLDRIAAPVLLFTSRVDHVVDTLSRDTLLKRLPAIDHRQLEHSFHVATLDHDAQRIESESIEFIRTICG